MNGSAKITAIGQAESSILEVELERFEAAWRSGSPPAIEQFLSSISSARVLSDSTRRQYCLAELVAIDLERRWREPSLPSDRSSAIGDLHDSEAMDKPLLEAYLRRFPELPTEGPLLVNLVGQEYRTRVLWGDGPYVAEYLRRFPAEADAVRQELSRIDREISIAGLQRVEPAEQTDPPTPGYDAPTVDSDQSPSTGGSDVPVPKTIDRFEVIEVLGSGGFGVVYQAFDPDLQREVAIKVPRVECVEARGGTAAYLAEARTIAKLDHPGIVPVFEMGSLDDGRCYVVTKLMPGGDLAQLVASAPLSFERSVQLVARVAEALHHAHARGVVHRDVKPSNILLDADGNPLIVDFGLAMHEDDFGSGPGFVGTLTHMSPEQARDTGHLVDARSDIFSLGVVLFELLAGKSPYRGKSKRQLAEEITACDPRPVRQINSQVPQELDRICQTARATLPADRYATAQDFADDLRAFLRRRARRAVPHWAVPLGVGALAVVAVVAIALSSIRVASVPPPPPTGGMTSDPLSAPFLDMDRLVREGDIYRYEGVSIDDMPLRAKDRVVLDVHLQKGEEGYVYVFQYAKGRAPRRLWPAPGTDLARPAKLRRLRLPQQGTWLELSGESGPMMFVSAVSSTPLEENELAEVERVAFSFEDSRQEPPMYELVFPPDKRRPALRSAARHEIVRLDPVRLRSSPQRELQKHFDAFSALVFCFECPEPD